MASPAQIIFVLVIICSIGAFLAVAYVTSLTDIQLFAILVIMLALVGAAAFYAFGMRKQDDGDSLDSELRLFEKISNWWYKKTYEELTYKGSRFMERFAGEVFYVCSLSRKVGGLQVGVILGTKPLRVVRWDYINAGVDSMNKFWEEFSPAFPGKPSKHVGVEESIHSMKDKPLRIEKETVTKDEKKESWNRTPEDDEN